MEDVAAILGVLPVGDIAWGTIVSFGILSIIRGWLVPRRVHEDRIADKDDQIQHLRTALGKSEEANAMLLKQNGELIDSGETTDRLIEALRARAQQKSGE